MERKDKEDWVRKCMYMDIWMTMDVEGARARGRPRKTWLEEVKSDMKGLCLANTDALDRLAWTRKIVEIRADPGLPEAPLTFFPGRVAVKWGVCRCVFGYMCESKRCLPQV